MSSSVSRLSSLFKSKSKSKSTPVTTTSLFKSKSKSKPTPVTKTPSKPTPTPTPSLKSRIQSLMKESDLTKVVQNFKQFSETPTFRAHDTIYDKIIYRLSNAKEYTLIQDLIEHQKKYPDFNREGFVIRLISLYGKAYMPDHAQKLFDEMPERTVKSSNALIKAYIHSKEFDKAVKVFREMQISGNDITYNVVMHGLCEKGDLDSAEMMLDEMESNGVKPDVYTFNILTNGFYSVQGRFDDGERVWMKMEKMGIKPNVVSFNGKLQGLLNEGKVSEAGKVLEELKKRDLEPSVRTYNILVRWYCKAGLLDEAKGVYDRMKKSDNAPDRVTYKAIIPCCIEKGDLDAAFEMSKESLKKCSVDPAILQSVVNLFVKDSRVVEAEALVKLSGKEKYCFSKLNMPTESCLV